MAADGCSLKRKTGFVSAISLQLYPWRTPFRMMRDNFELTAMPTVQTPECSTPASPYADGNSDGEYFSALTAPRHNEDGMQRHEFSLPPVDGGKDAWLFLAACFAVDALVWGMCSLPVFPFCICFRYARWFRGSGN